MYSVFIKVNSVVSGKYDFSCYDPLKNLPRLSEQLWENIGYR